MTVKELIEQLQYYDNAQDWMVVIHFPTPPIENGDYPLIEIETESYRKRIILNADCL